MENLILEKSEDSVIDLDVKIKNDSFDINETDTVVRVVIENYDNLNYSFNGFKNGDKYSVKIPKLENIIDEGKKKCFIEVVCCDRYFKIWEGEVDITGNATQIDFNSKNTKIRRMSLKEAIDRKEVRCQLVTITEEVLV